jgi:hypothetical protein
MRSVRYKIFILFLGAIALGLCGVVQTSPAMAAIWYDRQPLPAADGTAPQLAVPNPAQEFEGVNAPPQDEQGSDDSADRAGEASDSAPTTTPAASPAPVSSSGDVVVLIIGAVLLAVGLGGYALHVRKGKHANS